MPRSSRRSIILSRPSKTVRIQAGAASAKIEGTSAVYATARATSTGSATTDTDNGLGQENSAAVFGVYRHFLVFDTSIIPDSATILKATLTLTCTTDSSTAADFDVVIQKHDWSVQNPIGAGNREAAYDACLAATAESSIWRNTSGLVINTPYESGALDITRISKTGSTYYSLLSSRDVAGTAPGVATVEYLVMAMDENATPAYRPTLNVTYLP